MLALTVIFLVLDVFYVFWAYQAKKKFPPYIAKYLTKSLIGFTSIMNQTLSSNLGKIKSRITSRISRGNNINSQDNSSV